MGMLFKIGVVARSAFKYEVNLANYILFFCSIVYTTSVGHLFERISIFYQIVLKILRLENHIFWIKAT